MNELKTKWDGSFYVMKGFALLLEDEQLWDSESVV